MAMPNPVTVGQPFGEPQRDPKCLTEPHRLAHVDYGPDDDIPSAILESVAYAEPYADGTPARRADQLLPPARRVRLSDRGGHGRAGWHHARPVER
jgi:hypothetical protein